MSYPLSFCTIIECERTVTTVLCYSFCRRCCLTHKAVQRCHRWFTMDADESRYLLPIEDLARHDTFCPDCREQDDWLVTHGRLSE